MTLQQLLSGAKTLDSALRLLAAARPPWRVADVVVQDEYSHDVILSTKDDRWAVLDVT